MKFVSITFDDGRKDNYTTAFPIMKKYNFKGTIFVTTGFIDNSWEKDRSWLSAGEALSVDELQILKQNGWEIALHGDRHVTEINDTERSIQKMNGWVGYNDTRGFSMPNSNAPIDQVKLFEKMCNDGERISYIRRGRGINTKSVGAKCLFALYSMFNLSWAYNRFNIKSINQVEKIDKTNIKSVVIRMNDNPKMIKRFVDQAPDGTLIVFMLHSVIEKGDPLHNVDPWCFDSVLFDKMCFELKELEDKNKIEVVTLERLLLNDKI